MKRGRVVIGMLFFSMGIAGFELQLGAVNGGWTLIGWNNLGMHCLDSDYSIFSILPPYNVLYAQLIDANGQLVTNGQGVTVTCEAIADPSGSINTTSRNKTNFWDWVLDLFGVSLAVDRGLAGKGMPGPGNTPQFMDYDSSLHQFTAEGIPLTPYDDSGEKNYYPMMHLVARDSAGRILATTDVVLPVSDEMDCRACHASDSSPAAEPAAGWAFDPNPERDYRLNILLRHDESLRSFAGYQDLLTTAGYSPQGLFATVTIAGKPVLCDGCHASNALPGTGISGLPPLTQAVHSRHSGVTDPTNGRTLEDIENRTACYRCHPGSTTRCLRGAMGSAVAADGSLAIQCQSCHGPMSMVGAAGRQGWLDEPNCQSCHTGTATQNRGQIRFTTAFDSGGLPRIPAVDTFATNPNVPAAGFSLFRFSAGHGGLQCEACHGSTHAIYPSTERNDNIQELQLQGHQGAVSDCTVCHNTTPNTISGGPHGMHPVGQQWANGHGDAAENNGAGQCRTCHGSDYRGTVLSRSLGDRNLSTRYGLKQFWRGFQIGCYTCHNGPGSENGNSNRAPVAADASATTTAGAPVAIPLTATDADNNPLTLRIVSQPNHGTVGLNNRTATFIPAPDYAGSDNFTFAAWDGASDSNLGTVTLTVASRFFAPFYQADASSYTGFAISNYSSARGANVRFTAFGPDGQPLPFPANNRSYFLEPRAQLAKLGSEIFQTGLTTTQAGWVEIAGDIAELGCLFQFGDFAGSRLDGSIALTQPERQLLFTRVFEGPGAFRGQTASTFLSIANPTAGPVTMTLNLLGLEANQILAPARTITVPASGVFYGTVTEIFHPGATVTGGWIDAEVTAGEGAIGFELIRFPDARSVVGLNAVSGGAVNRSYSAQLAVTPEYFTHIKLINTSTMARTATLHAIAEDGSELAPAVPVSLAVGQARALDAALTFGLSSAVGSLRVDADGPGVIGDVLFGEPTVLRFAASSPLQSRLFSQAVFSQVANAAGYFTGLALLNPNSQPAYVTLDVYSETGAGTGSTPAPILLGPGERISKLLTELVPSTAGQMRGFIQLHSTLPIVGQQLFGDTSMTFLSAAPPRIIN